MPQITRNENLHIVTITSREELACPRLTPLHELVHPLLHGQHFLFFANGIQE
jgi:Zn-dependent peptidase ImmA (M78 family)